MLLRVLVAPGGVAKNDAGHDKEDKKIEDENGSDWSEECSVEDNVVTYEAAAEIEENPLINALISY